MPNLLQRYRKSNETVMRNGHECWLWTKMDPFLGPFCPNKGKYDFLKKQNLSDFNLYGCPTSRKVTEKVMKQSWGMAMNVDFDTKWTPFWGPFAQIRANTIYFEKIRICQILASMDAQLPAKLQKKVMKQSWGMAMNVDFDPKWTLFWGPFAQIRANKNYLKKSEFVRF